MQLLNVLHEYQMGTCRTINFEETKYKPIYKNLLKNVKGVMASAHHKLALCVMSGPGILFLFPFLLLLSHKRCLWALLLLFKC